MFIKFVIGALIALTSLLISSPLFAHALTGKASWYGPGFQGRLTANGERYNMHEMTAAHKTLPFGTIVAVTNLNNGRSVRLRITDRGPFIKGRVIDTSKAAAIQLGFIDSGVAPVELEVIYLGDNAYQHQTRPIKSSFKKPLKKMKNRVVKKAKKKQALKRKYKRFKGGDCEFSTIIMGPTNCR